MAKAEFFGKALTSLTRSVKIYDAEKGYLRVCATMVRPVGFCLLSPARRTFC